MTMLAQLLLSHTKGLIDLPAIIAHSECSVVIKSIKWLGRSFLFEFAVETENEEILQEQI